MVNMLKSLFATVRGLNTSTRCSTLATRTCTGRRGNLGLNLRSSAKREVRSSNVEGLGKTLCNLDPRLDRLITSQLLTYFYFLLTRVNSNRAYAVTRTRKWFSDV